MASNEAIERGIITSARDILEDQRIDASANFFEAGGDSLSAIALVESIEEQFGVEVPLEKVWDADSLADLATIVANSQNKTEAVDA